MEINLDKLKAMRILAEKHFYEEKFITLYSHLYRATFSTLLLPTQEWDLCNTQFFLAHHYSLVLEKIIYNFFVQKS